MKEKIDIEKILKEGQAVSINPIGTSMWPLFVERNDQAIIKPVSSFKRKIRRGDVCLYRRPEGQLVIHRVFKVNKNVVYFVGDHQNKIEGPLSLDCIKGVMTSFVRRGISCSCSNPIYIILSSIWLFIRPMRLEIIKMASIIKNSIN